MSGSWAEVFLGIIAASALMVAVALVAVLVAMGLLTQRIARMVGRFEAQVTPILGHLNTMASEAARATALAGAQVDRADRLLADVAHRIEELMTTVQGTLGAPAREGRALLNAFRAGLRAVLDLRSHARHRSRPDDDDVLFI